MAIKGINVIFQQHALAEYRQAHQKLNTQYSIVITNIDNLFDTEANIPALVTAKLVESMDLPNDEDMWQKWNKCSTAVLWH